MNTTRTNQTASWVVAISIGFAVCYMIFNNSSELRKVKYQLQQAEFALSSDRITTADQLRSIAINERERNGEYILKFERPVDRKLMQAGIEAFAFRLASNSAPALRELLSRLGASKEVSWQIEQHDRKIALASLETEMMMEQLLLARQAYNKHMRSIFSAQSYKAYRQYEDSKPAVSEFQRLEQFAKRLSIAVEPVYKETIVAGIYQSQAYSERSWHGPYDGWPEIAMGQEDVTDQLDRQSARLREAFDKLHRSLVETNVPMTYIALIDAYYSAQLHIKNYAVERLRTNEVSSAP